MVRDEATKRSSSASNREWRTSDGQISEDSVGINKATSSPRGEGPTQGPMVKENKIGSSGPEREESATGSVQDESATSKVGQGEDGGMEEGVAAKTTFRTGRRGYR